MEKKCCEVKVVELDDGYNVTITGEKVKEKAEALFENCCGKNSSWKNVIGGFCCK